VLTTPDAARDYVREAKEQGYDFLKVYNRLRPEVYAALVDEADTQGIPFAGHVPDAVGLANVLDANQRTIEHLSGYFAALQREDSPFRQGANAFGRPAMVRFIDEARIEEIAAQTRAAGTWNCVTLVVMDKFRARFDLQAELQRPEMRYVSPVWRSQWMGRIDPDQPPNDDQRLTLEAGSAMRRTIVASLHAAGARILLGSDTPNPFVVPGFSIHEELANLTQSGLSPYEAIRAGTHDAAEFLGALDTFGTVRAGRRADLMLTASNPLDDVANLAHPRGVMLRGRWLDRAELDQRLEALADSHAD
jgi:imidazolonepropionase-like amidohydrolase